MRDIRLRQDIERAVIDGYALPLGLTPSDFTAPTQGYTVDYVAGEDDEPDTYVFHIVLSFEKLALLLDRLFDLLPHEVFGIVEIGSRDAYRSLDVYMAQEPMSREEFRAGWRQFENFLLEDGSVAVGVNSEDPFIEIFLDQWKGVSVHTPLLMREPIERILSDFSLREVMETWSPEMDERVGEVLRGRPILLLEDEYSPDVDEVLLQLRHTWNLELNVPAENNLDDAGRELGRTLWHALVIVEATADNDRGAYASIWATASSIIEMESLIDTALQAHSEWRFAEIYTLDRVAFDERPDELADLPPRREETGVHLVFFEPWDVVSDDASEPVDGSITPEGHDRG